MDENQSNKKRKLSNEQSTKTISSNSNSISSTSSNPFEFTSTTTTIKSNPNKRPISSSSKSTITTIAPNKTLFPQQSVLKSLFSMELSGKRKNSTTPTLTKANPSATIFTGKVPKSFLVGMSQIADLQRKLLGCCVLGFSSDGNHLISMTSDGSSDETGVLDISILSNAGSLKHDVCFQVWDCSKILSPIANEKRVKLLRNFHLFGERVTAQNERGSFTSVIEMNSLRIALVHSCGNVNEFSNYREDRISIVQLPFYDSQGKLSQRPPISIQSNSSDVTSFSYSVYPGLTSFPKFEPNWTVISENLILLNSGNAIHLLELATTANKTTEQNESLNSSKSTFRTWPNSSADYSILLEEPLTNKSGVNPLIVRAECFAPEKYLASMKENVELLKGTRLLDYDLKLVHVNTRSRNRNEWHFQVLLTCLVQQSIELKTKRTTTTTNTTTTTTTSSNANSPLSPTSPTTNSPPTHTTTTNSPPQIDSDQPKPVVSKLTTSMSSVKTKEEESYVWLLLEVNVESGNVIAKSCSKVFETVTANHNNVNVNANLNVNANVNLNVNSNVTKESPSSALNLSETIKNPIQTTTTSTIASTTSTTSSPTTTKPVKLTTEQLKKMIKEKIFSRTESLRNFGGPPKCQTNLLDNIALIKGISKSRIFHPFLPLAIVL